MQHQSRLIVLIGLLAIIAFAGSVTQAQCRAGCPSSDDDSSSSSEPPAPVQDQDSDGVLDFVDGCPTLAGTGFNNGCPDGSAATAVPGDTGTNGVAPPQTSNQTIAVTWASMETCMVGIGSGAASSVNVRQQQTVNSAIIGQLAPGTQFEPWFRDYDENNEVWFGGAPSAGGYGWVKDSVVIDNGLCANLAQVIHVDASDEPIGIVFDPNAIPRMSPSDTRFVDLLDQQPSAMFMSLYSGLTPPDPTPLPPPSMPPFQFNGLGDLSNNLMLVIGGSSNASSMMEVVDDPYAMFIVLPPIGNDEGQCPADSLLMGLVQNGPLLSNSALSESPETGEQMFDINSLEGLLAALQAQMADGAVDADTLAAVIAALLDKLAQDRVNPGQAAALFGAIAASAGDMDSDALAAMLAAWLAKLQADLDAGNLDPDTLAGILGILPVGFSSAAENQEELAALLAELAALEALQAQQEAQEQLGAAQENSDTSEQDALQTVQENSDTSEQDALQAAQENSDTSQQDALQAAQENSDSSQQDALQAAQENSDTSEQDALQAAQEN
ncbi:MAG: hypothetical protein H7175_25695, partial [Burkholderiales bacterium]|nr:hypothetical protein [Anaerolineae bacterium]